jgi:hypothetical protein
MGGLSPHRPCLAFLRSREGPKGAQGSEGGAVAWSDWRRLLGKAGRGCARYQTVALPVRGLVKIGPSTGHGIDVLPAFRGESRGPVPVRTSRGRPQPE